MNEPLDWAVRPPALAGLTALTELEVVGEARLPPDWRQLRRLRRLTVKVDDGYAVDPDFRFERGTAPLTALTALTCLEVGLPPQQAMGPLPGAAVGGGLGGSCLSLRQ